VRPTTAALLARRRSTSAFKPESRARAASPLILASLVAIGLAFAWRAGNVARTDAITSDETTHLIHTLGFWATGDDQSMWELGTPRLPHVLAGGASYLALRAKGLMPNPATPQNIGQIVLSGSRLVTLPARCVAILWGLALLGIGYVIGARVGGPWAGVITAGLLSLIPEILAHSAIAGSDMPFTVAAMLALLLLVHYTECPTLARWLVAALAIGLAWSIRHTALLLFPLAGLTHLVTSWRRNPPANLMSALEHFLTSAWSTVGLAVVSFLVLWAGDGLGTIRVGDLAERTANVTVPQRLGPIELEGLPLPTSVVSLLKQVRHQRAGHEAYFLGALSEHGWPAYFPVAFGLKTPVGLLLLFAIAAARTRLKTAWDGLALACFVLLWGTLLTSHVNIGIRYAILTFPLVMPWVAAMFTGALARDRIWTPLCAGAIVWFLAASLGAEGRFLSSFNELGGGPNRGWLYLADSNIDWGQDFDRLAHVLARREIAEVTTDISSERLLECPGVLAIKNPSRAFQVPAQTPPNRRLYDASGGYLPVHTRYVAVSVSRLMGLYSQNDMSWLRTRKLVERVGESVLLFDMDLPADQPFSDL
jgi:hypothetical protein